MNNEPTAYDYLIISNAYANAARQHGLEGDERNETLDEIFQNPIVFAVWRDPNGCGGHKAMPVKGLELVQAGDTKSQRVAILVNDQVEAGYMQVFWGDHAEMTQAIYGWHLSEREAEKRPNRRARRARGKN